MGRAESLREDAIAKLHQARAIITAAEDAGRTMSAEDDARCNGLLAEANRLTALSEASRTAGDAGPAGRDMSGQPIVPWSTRSGSAAGGAGIVTPDGIRIMGPKDRFAALVPQDAPGQGLTLSAMIRSMVTGKDAGVDFRAQMGGGSPSGGGVLVPDPLSANLIDLARNQARVIQAGASSIPMTSSTLRIPRQIAGAAGQWKGENAALSAISDLTFDAVTLTAKTIMAVAKMSVELAEDGQDVEGIIDRDLGAALALAIDAAALRGAIATPPAVQLNPIGILNSGATVTPLGDPLTTYGPFSAAVERIRTANGEPGSVIYSPAVSGILDRLTNSLHDPLTPPESFRNLGKFITNQADTGEAYLGDFSRLLIGLRTDVTLEVSRVAGDSDGSAFRNLQVWVRAYARMDCVVTRSSYFEVLTDIEEAEEGA